MAKKKTYTTKTKPTSVDEPAVSYGARPFVIFNSFEEENEYTYKQYALIPPLENFKTVTTLVKQFYQKELKENPTLGNRIYFD